MLITDGEQIGRLGVALSSPSPLQPQQKVSDVREGFPGMGEQERTACVYLFWIQKQYTVIIFKKEKSEIIIKEVDGLYFTQRKIIFLA